MGGATGGGGVRQHTHRHARTPPHTHTLLRPVPRRGYNAIYVVHLQETTAGRAAKVSTMTLKIWHSV